MDIILRLLAPIAPFTSEYLYRKMHPDHLSVHASSYPVADKSLMDEKTEARIGMARNVLELTRRARQNGGIKGRQPVKEILVHSEKISESDLEPVREEMNARKIKIIGESEKPERTVIKVVNSKAAPILKGKMPEFLKFIEELNSSNQVQRMKNAGISFEGMEIPSDALQFVTEPEKGYVREEENSVSLFLNTEIDSELELEGLSREIIRRIQVMRKEMNLDYDASINLAIHGNEKIRNAVEKYRNKIMAETLCSTLNVFVDNSTQGRMWEVEDQKIYLEFL